MSAESRKSFEAALFKIDGAKVIIEKVLSKKSVTIGELREARRLLLDAVRYDIDMYACGHMPDQRHY